eukprot:10668437-Heterocapsa_arctica.AAC.1
MLGRPTTRFWVEHGIDLSTAFRVDHSVVAASLDACPAASSEGAEACSLGGHRLCAAEKEGLFCKIGLKDPGK